MVVSYKTKTLFDLTTTSGNFIKIENNYIYLEKYDLNVLLSPLLDYFSEDEDLFQKISCIKRGSGVMELRYSDLIFRDFLNFSRLALIYNTFTEFWLTLSGN